MPRTIFFFFNDRNNKTTHFIIEDENLENILNNIDIKNINIYYSNIEKFKNKVSVNVNLSDEKTLGNYYFLQPVQRAPYGI